MRPTLLVVSTIFAAFALVGCQDSAASNSERETHMGDIRAAGPPPAASSAPAPAVPIPAAAPPAPATASAGH
jgi:hypothetical protein